MICALLFEALPCAQAVWHRLNCLSLPKAALLLSSRNFVRWVIQPRSTDWHKNYYTENLCSRNLKYGQSSEKQLCCQNEHCGKAQFAQTPKVLFLKIKRRGGENPSKVRGKAYRNYGERAEMRLAFFSYFSVANLTSMMIHVCK